DILILVGFALIFYFMLWRPQSKRAKEHKALVDGLAKGDEIVTSGGILGKISKVEEQFILVEVSEGMELRFQKASVAAALPKGTLKNS
ncbi:MAG: preprotein translocase subunit YajC, partial [Gammaproteobacteria bacterium]